MSGRIQAILTVDLEDYRRQQLRDHVGDAQPPNPTEVERQLDILLEHFDAIGARATFFTVGRLARELRSSVWARIVGSHELGCHGDEHERVSSQGPQRFGEDVRRAKASLESASGRSVRSYRAPYFSSDGCDPWFGETLARTGFAFDSSRRIGRPSPAFRGTLPLPGSSGAVSEVPMPSLGYGSKRLTVVGGTYFRLLPLHAIEGLLERARANGFVPMVYLHPYDVDPSAAPLDYPGSGYWPGKAGDWLRRVGRAGALAKLTALARTYEFEPIERVVGLDAGARHEATHAGAR
jgi:peptidoglycan/xylan/chitin deacetylase (PgdA/CDA1 family)